MSNIQTAFGEHLRKVRGTCGISQEKLAEIAGLHRTYISSVERGERNVSLETIERLAEALKVSMSAITPDFEMTIKK